MCNTTQPDTLRHALIRRRGLQNHKNVLGHETEYQHINPLQGIKSVNPGVGNKIYG